MTWHDPASGRVEYRPSRDALGSQSQTWPPIGSGVPFFGVEAKVPANWLLARGQEVFIETYQALYDVIGLTYNAAPTAGYFQLPDLRGRIPVGLDNMGGSDAGRLAVANTLGLTGGTETHTLTAGESGTTAHTHGLRGGTGIEGVVASGAVDVAGAFAAGWWKSGVVTKVTDSSAGASASSAHNNMQPYILTNWIIRAW